MWKAIQLFVFFFLFFNSSFSFAKKALVTDFNLLLSSKDWEWIGTPRNFDNDLVVLEDGTKIWVRFDEIPDLHYFFGRIEFSLDELAAMAFKRQGSETKVQYVTRNGQNFIGTLKKPNIEFEELRYSFKKDSPTLNEEYTETQIQTSSLSYIFFKPRKNPKPLINEDYFSIVLKNGDRFPFKISSFQIRVASGSEKREERIRAQDISDVWVHSNYLVGYLKTEGLDYETKKFEILDLDFYVTLAKNNQLLAIPFSEISRIKNDKGALIQKTPYQLPNWLSAATDMEHIPSGRFMVPLDAIQEKKPFAAIPGLKGYFDQHKKLDELLKVYNIYPTKEIPSLMTNQPAFYVDRNLVTNAQYEKFVKETNYRLPSHWEGSFPRDEEKSKPVTHVTYRDAAAYAKWSGKKLPMFSQWVRAMRLKEESLLSKSHSFYPYSEWTLSAHEQANKEFESSEMENVFFYMVVGIRERKNGKFVYFPMEKQDFSNEVGFRCVMEE
jgi:hypothetical protein